MPPGQAKEAPARKKGMQAFAIEVVDLETPPPSPHASAGSAPENDKIKARSTRALEAGQAPAAHPSGGARLLSGVPQPANVPAQAPSQQQELIDMGFAPARAELALKVCGGDVGRAANWLLASATT